MSKEEKKLKIYRYLVFNFMAISTDEYKANIT